MEQPRQELVEIAAYVRFAEALPVVPEAVAAYIGYDTSSEPLLNPTAVKHLFEGVVAHAALWRQIANDSKEQLRLLCIGAEQIVRDTSGLVRGLESLSPIVRAQHTLGHAVDGAQDATSGQTLDADTRARLEHLVPYVESLRAATHGAIATNGKTNRDLSDFRNQTSELEARVSATVDQLKTAESPLGKELTIEPALDAFRQATERMIRDLPQGSDIAAAMRQRVDATLKVFEDRRGELQERQRLTYAVGRLFLHLRGLGYSLLGASSALTHIWSSASDAQNNLKLVGEKLDAVRTDDTLLGFYTTSKSALRGWLLVRDESSALYKQF